MAFFITGVSGFIGFHLATALLARGEEVIGIDIHTSSPFLSKERLNLLKQHRGFMYQAIDVCDQSALKALFAQYAHIHSIIHLAAQAGVRRSREEPALFARSNFEGLVSLLEASLTLKQINHIVYASSSAVYGRTKEFPFKETNPLGEPSSFYAVTKHSNELTAAYYKRAYNLPLTALRFFTVYGAWGRPDMAYFKFAKAISDKKPITLWEGQNLSRDFTFISDVVAGVLSLLDRKTRSFVPDAVNIGSGKPESVLKLIKELEKNLNMKADIEICPRPLEDLEQTWASIELIKKLTGWSPKTSINEGIAAFSKWFRVYKKLENQKN
ncbi:NAD-dependent epimerase/dehydratase family protein [Aristophania vespae]|uniref:NAD-dependent epimerase/dehydratase family protein n=1 Tax=Aristophania vespae TaxID=2697033 RepID=A0A6P1NEP2_9PROT|nr:NAD-dependent epimerase/dehydratase family protein [Aristophania vespae]QHI94954.1 NAD-dependent epimerase/dehydratase family protein [Aristophania vespae]